MNIKWRILSVYLIATSFSLFLFLLGEKAVNRQTFVFDWATFILAILLPGGVVYYLTNRFSLKLRKLSMTARSISKGDFVDSNDVYFLDSSDELGEIGKEMITVAQQFKINLQKNTQEAEKVQTILASMQEGVIALDQVGRVVLSNTAAESIFAYSEEQLKGKYFIDVLSYSELEELVQNALEKGKSGTAEITLSEQIIRVQVNPFLGEQIQMRPRGAVIVGYDITELRRLEQVRTDFVGNVSHELRTPLTSIKGFVETLLDGAAHDPAYCERFLTIIQKETLRLQRLIDDLLTLSRIENRRGDLDESSSRVQSGYKKIEPVISSYAKAKKLDLEVKLPSDLPAVAMGPDLLSQVLLNLLENAVKYTTTGKVELSGSQRGAFVHLEFTDTGCGIPEKDLPRIFERFYRVDKARSREQGGTGLGLSIVKHIVEGSNGKIGVTSRLGVGSVFTCDLPVAEQEELYEKEK